MAGLSAKAYWTAEEAAKYDKSTSIQKVQAEMAERILTELKLPPDSLVLDIGCGTGFGTRVIERFGLRTVGLDVSAEMLELAKTNGLRLLVRGDWQALPFKDGTFDAIISTSTLQWVSGKSPAEVTEQYMTVAEESNRVLKDKGKAGIQFYPATPAEFELVKRVFKSAAFGGYVIEEGVGKKVKRYLMFEKKW